jgi:RNA polymerase sigma-70 factor (ECF subfamily)
MLNQELFDRCKRNESRAQRTLYDLYKARLMGLCRRYSRDKEDARDMLQESFVKIFLKLNQVESVDKFEGWMKTIAVRTAIDHYHKVKRLDLQAYTDKEYEVSDTDHDLILENLSDEYLVQAINALPEGCRLVFNLFEVEGYAHAEIAELLTISESTSRSQLHHAKYLLKQKLIRLGIKRYEKFA